MTPGVLEASISDWYIELINCPVSLELLISLSTNKHSTGRPITKIII